MGAKTNIEWTDGGSTWTPIRARVETAVGVRLGWHCEHVSEGCRNCYAESFNRRLGTSMDYKPGELRNGVELFLDEKMLAAPLGWRKPRMIFVCSMTDLFADFVPDEFIDKIFSVMALAPQHTFQVLTKRPERMRAYINGHASKIPYLGRMPLERIHLEAAGHMEGDGGYMDALKDAGNVYSLYLDAPWPLPNVWLGTSVEDQATSDERIPILLDTPAAKRFISAEPLLGPVDLYNGDPDPRLGGHRAIYTFLGDWWEPGGTARHGIDWVIVGGESGRGARPMHPDWVRSLRDQCAVAEVAFFFKQWGAWQPRAWCKDGGTHAMHSFRPSSFQKLGHHPDSIERTSIDSEWSSFALVGKKAAGAMLDGREHREFPI